MRLQTGLQTGSAALLAMLALVLLSACQPIPAAERRVTATLLTDGTGVVHNGRPAVSGEPLGSGDWVRTDFAGSALILFSDGSRVQIAAANEPVYLAWIGNTLEIRIDNAAIEYIEGAVLEFVRMIGNLAGVFNDSHFITVEDRAEAFRHLLFEGRAEMIFPAAGRQILPGQYALVTPAGEVEIRPIPPSLLREVRALFQRWDFAQVERLRMPNLLDRQLDEALAEIGRRGLSEGRITGEVRRDSIVIGQVPRAGASVEPGTPVDLSVRAAIEPALVPELRRLSYAEARQVLARSGLRLGRVDGPQTRAARVVAQEPAPGSRVPPESAVNLLLEAPPDLVRPVQPDFGVLLPQLPGAVSVPVPEVRRTELKQAIERLQAAGLRVGRVEGSQAGDAVWVIAQSPEPGAQVPRGSVVDLTVRGVIQ